MDNESVREERTRGQFRDIVATMITAIPDLSRVNAERIQGCKAQFIGAIRGVFNNLIGFTHDKTKDDWELLEDVGFVPVISSFDELELVSPLKSGEIHLPGEELVQRAREELRANLGQRHAEYILQHQEGIPEEWRANYLIFPGTIWRGSGGARVVPFLYWGGGRWFLYFCWLEDDFDSDDRLVRPRE